MPGCVGSKGKQLMPAAKSALCRQCGELFADQAALEAHRQAERCLSEKELRAQGFKRSKYERWQAPQARP